MIKKLKQLEQFGQKEIKILGTVESTGNQPVYNPKERSNRFADVVRFRGVIYDLREETDTGWYRLTSEDYFNSPNPAYIRVDRNGNVVETKTIQGEDWGSKDEQ